MDGFRQWALAVCTAAVVCTLLQMLFPDTGLGRQGRFVLPCLFLCVLLSPISGGIHSVKLPDFTAKESVDSAGLAARVRQQTVAQVNAALQQMLEQSFEKYGWEVKKVVADVDIDEAGSIDMGQITVYVDEEVARRATQVGQVAEKRLGVSVVVAAWEDTA